MVQRCVTWVVLTVFVCGGGGVTKPSGIEQFWTDDYKIFEQVYGKTSDRDIYGESLPPSITFGRDLDQEASKKNERYLLSLDTDSDEDPYSLEDHYSSLLNKQALKLYSNKKPATSSINFVSYSDFKPISQSTDPETYNYLKHFEELNKEEKLSYPQSAGGFKSYSNYLGTEPEETDAYKSIQEILDAHEGNKGDGYSNDDEGVKYITYGKGKRKKPPRVYNDVLKPRCAAGRCRKRGAGSFRSRRRPHVRGLKAVVVI